MTDRMSPQVQEPGEGELALCRAEFARQLEHIRRAGGGEYPSPPASIRKRGFGCNGFEPMYEREARFVARSYNSFVALWNLHERSRDLPLGPRWLDAKNISATRPLSMMMMFEVDSKERPYGVMRLRDWHPWHGGWSFCRNPIAVENIVWAGWRVRAGGMTDEEWEEVVGARPQGPTG